MNRRLIHFIFCAGLTACFGCRTPETSDASNDSETASEIDSETEVSDAGADAGGPLPPCAPDMNSALGLLPQNSPQKGGEDSVDVVVNIFSNLRCTHCARLAEIADILWARPEWQGRVRLYFRHFAKATEIHAAAIAAFNQGETHFWAVHNEIYDRLRENGEFMTVPDVLDFAEQELGLDMEQFEADMASEATAERLAEDRAVGEALGVTGTPTVFVCDERIPTADLESAVSEYL